MVKSIHFLLKKRKYEFLLSALLLHLFIAVFITDLEFYAKVVWPVNMSILAIFSIGIFSEKTTFWKIVKNLLALTVILLPIVIIFVKPGTVLMQTINITHIAFYTVIFIEVLRFLIKPSYINADIVSASICGYLLLIEIGIFGMQSVYYALPNAFKGIDTTSFTTTYLDLVYFCSITLTSIGFGDITPAHHISKLATSMLGIAGQFYSVVLLSIMISKYTSFEANDSVKGK